VAALALSIRVCWRYVQRRVRPKQGSRKLEAVFLFATAGAISFGCIMAAGTLLLGHTRPVWMEFDKTPSAAATGLVIGGLFGLVLDLSVQHNTKNS